MTLRTREIELLRVLDDALHRARAIGGRHVACRSGCFGCCIGPFPITAMDADRLARGLATVDTATAQRILHRAEEAARTLAALDYPGHPETGLLHPNAGDVLFEPRFLNIPCPVLDLETGACLLYAHRPVACRTYGTAIRLEGRSMPHCRLNYTELSAPEIEALRVDVDAGPASRLALDEFAPHATTEAETTIAFALAAPPQTAQP